MIQCRAYRRFIAVNCLYGGGLEVVVVCGVGGFDDIIIIAFVCYVHCLAFL